MMGRRIFGEECEHLQERGEPRNWSALQPPTPRPWRLFCCGRQCGCCPATCLCLPIVTLIANWLGLVGLILAFVVGKVLYCCCGWLLWLYRCYGQSWNWQGPGSWVGQDMYLKTVYLVWQGLLFGWKTPSTTPEFIGIEHLKPKGPLRKDAIAYSLQVSVPNESEAEGPMQSRNFISFITEWLSENFAKLMPLSDDLTPFGPDEDPVAYVMGCIGNVFPRITDDWSDKQSDRALTRFVLHGLGAHRIETVQENGAKLYVVRTNALAGLPVRGTFAHYGGDAYFDTNWTPVKIVDAGLQPGTIVEVRPGEAGWAHAKFRFRSSLSVLVTLVDHLYDIHLQSSNLFLIACREQLSPGHPVRRFLTPFMFNTISVNSSARQMLIQPMSMGPRTVALTGKGMSLAFVAAPKLAMSGMTVHTDEGGPFINRLDYYDYLNGKGIDTEYLRQARRLYEIFFRFANNYLECYYPTVEELVMDTELKAMFNQVINSFELSLSAITIGPSKMSPQAEAALWKHLLANFMFVVTAGHEQTGAIQAYTQDCSFCAAKWLPGQNIATKESALLQAFLISLTSQAMPLLMGSDWTYLFPATVAQMRGEEVPSGCAGLQVKAPSTDPISAFRAFQAELQEMAKYCDEYNAAAPQRPFPENFPLYVLHPKFLETSISV